jgi:hypothetical protein
MSRRTDIVNRAVELIGPDKDRRDECFNAVHVALEEVKVSEAGLRKKFHRNTKRAKRAAGRWATGIRRLQDIFVDPNIPAENVLIIGGSDHLTDSEFQDQLRETWRLLVKWRQQAEAVQKQTGRLKFQFDAEKRKNVAEQAYRLLQQFNREISATEGRVFCRLAALLYGDPKAKFHSPCSKVMRRQISGQNFSH